MNTGSLQIVSTGPGDAGLISPDARAAIETADLVIGYRSYITLLDPLIENKKEVFTNGMRQEIDRCRKALEVMRAGKRVALVCGGDAGVFSLAGLVYELATQDEYDRISVIPGITAATAAAALLGAPLIHDFVILSLSDLLTQRELIERRALLALEGDFVIVLYNPKSIRRVELYPWVIRQVIEQKGEDTCIGIVSDAYRDTQRTRCMTAREALVNQELVDMRTIVIIGNSSTRLIGGKMVTRRGYTV